MSKATKNILFAAASLLFFLGLVAGFNYTVDPMCYYRCETVDLNRKSQNVFYRSAQTAAANPDAKVVIVGSSRGERVPPRWVEDVTGMKSINLSQGGSEVFLKTALLNIVLERNPDVKMVIWMADYFELNRSTMDIKTRLTPMLRKYSGMEQSGFGRGGIVERLQGLIDHRTLEAGLEMSKGSFNETYRPFGNGTEIDYRACQQPDFVGPTPPQMMDKKIAESRTIFGNFWEEDQDPIFWKVFENEIRSLSARGIDVIINIAPFHPKLVAQTERDVPKAALNQKLWAERVQALAGPHVRVLRYDKGIPGDDGGPRFWEDGAHPTCYAVMQMLAPGLRESKK